MWGAQVFFFLYAFFGTSFLHVIRLRIKMVDWTREEQERKAYIITNNTCDFWWTKFTIFFPRGVFFSSSPSSNCSLPLLAESVAACRSFSSVSLLFDVLQFIFYVSIHEKMCRHWVGKRLPRHLLAVSERIFTLIIRNRWSIAVVRSKAIPKWLQMRLGFSFELDVRFCHLR